MNVASMGEETYLPDDPSQIAAVHDFLDAHEIRHGNAPAPRYLLVGAGRDEQVELPEEVHRALAQVVDAMREGLAVTIAPRTLRLTTQQAADVLNISRPTLVALLKRGAMPYEQHGSHRKVLLSDVLEYRENRKQQQYAALDSLLSDDSTSQEEILARARAARKAVTRRRSHVTPSSDVRRRP